MGAVIGTIGYVTVKDELPISGPLPGLILGLMLGTIAHFTDHYGGEYLDNLQNDDSLAEDEETTEDSK
eukprot:5272562-Pyramimonas_sp.AAC.1